MCDFNKQIAWTKGGACIYAGEKELYEGEVEVKKRMYGRTYNRAVNTPDGWYKTESGDYWRVAQKGQGGPMKVGDSVAPSMESTGRRSLQPSMNLMV